MHQNYPTNASKMLQKVLQKCSKHALKQLQKNARKNATKMSPKMFQKYNQKVCRSDIITALKCAQKRGPKWHQNVSKSGSKRITNVTKNEYVCWLIPGLKGEALKQRQVKVAQKHHPGVYKTYYICVLLRGSVY